MKLIESENLNVIIPCSSPAPGPGPPGCKVAGWGAELSWAGGGRGGSHPSAEPSARRATELGNARTFSLISCLDMCLLSVLRLVYDHNNFVLFCVLFNV